MGYDPNQYNSSNDFYAQQQHADLEQLSATIANEKYQDRIMQLRIEIAKAPNVAVRSELQRILYEEKQKHRNRLTKVIISQLTESDQCLISFWFRTTWSSNACRYI